MIFGLLINTTWNAILISYLSIQKTNLPFNNLETLLSLTSNKIALLPGSAEEDEFRYSTHRFFSIKNKHANTLSKWLQIM